MWGLCLKLLHAASPPTGDYYCRVFIVAVRFWPVSGNLKFSPLILCSSYNFYTLKVFSQRQFSHLVLDRNTTTFFGSPHSVTAQKHQLDKVSLSNAQNWRLATPSAGIRNPSCPKHDRTPATLCKDLRDFTQSLEVNPWIILQLNIDHPSVQIIYISFHSRIFIDAISTQMQIVSSTNIFFFPEFIPAVGQTQPAIQ
jgi:hypothetical protein